MSSFPSYGSITVMHVQSRGVYLFWGISADGEDGHRMMFFFNSTYPSDDNNRTTEILQVFLSRIYV